MVALFKISICLSVFTANCLFSSDWYYDTQTNTLKKQDLVNELLDCSLTCPTFTLKELKTDALKKINIWINTIAPSDSIMFLHENVPVGNKSAGKLLDRSRESFKKAISDCINDLSMDDIEVDKPSKTIKLSDFIKLYDQLYNQFGGVMREKLSNFIDSLLPNNGLLLNPSLFSHNSIDIQMNVGYKRDSFKKSMLSMMQQEQNSEALNIARSFSFKEKLTIIITSYSLDLGFLNRSFFLKIDNLLIGVN